MTTHLDEVELVDALDGLLSASRDTHLERCSSCAERLRSLRASLAGLRQTADVPEPSPIFWEHFSRRVSDAVRAEGSAKGAGWWRPARIAALSAAALVAIATATTIILRMSSPSDGPQPAAAVVRQESATSDLTQPLALDVESDADWALVRAVADDLRWEDAPAAGIHARPGVADRVAVEMSIAERQELARLLEDELKRTGA